MLKNIKSFPSRVVVELTPICNLTCNMCPRHIIDKHSGYMSFKLWKKLIDEIYGNNSDCIVLPFWRGESLLHKEFIKFSLYALNKNIKLHLSTNGHYVDSTNSEVLSQYEFITFSLHTQIGFDNALKFISQYKSTKNTIQASFVDCEHKMMTNLKQLTNSNNLLGFDTVRLYEEHSKDGLFGYSGKDIFQTRTFCPKLNDTLVIAFDGTISRCNHIWDTEHYDMNISTIQQAWESKIMNNIRTNYPDTLCLPCDQWAGNTNGKLWQIKNKKVIETLKGNT